LWVSVLGSQLALGCFSTDEGVLPSPQQLNFPVGLALDPSGDRLYVANSDFDLRFNGGVLQVLDAARIREFLPASCSDASPCPSGRSCSFSGGEGSTLCVDARGSACAELGTQSAVERAQHPGICAPLPLDTQGVVLDAALIAPFVADVKYIPPASDGSRGARLVMPVRGDATVHWADVSGSDGKGKELDCGQAAHFAACDARHRTGDGADEEAPDGDKLPTEPFGIAVTGDGNSVFIGHQSQGKVSVFSNGSKGLRLESVLTGLPSNPMGLAVVKPPRAAALLGADYQPGVLVSFRYSNGVPDMELLRYHDAASAAPGNPYLSRSGFAVVTPNGGGFDSRGVAIDSRVRDACEAACDEQACAEPTADACNACLLDCATVPLDVYVANRSPHSLLIAQTRASFDALGRDDVPNFSDTIALRGGPSRVVVANVTGASGEPETRVFVVAFNAQLVYVFDPVTRRLEAHIETGPGPQALTVDEKRGLAYIAHFTDSYLSVVDLDRRHSTYARVLLNVGLPQAPRSSK
jgi:DNA-binding beta-propeller fold protein YncE